MSISEELHALILRLHHQEKWKVHPIAKHLRLHHSTVRRALGLLSIPGLPKSRPSLTDPYLPFIKESLERYPDLTASRLFQMVQERGYPGRPSHFRDVVALHRPRKSAEAYLRLQTLPGEQAQADWGSFGQHPFDGALRKLYAFVIVLSYSRMLYFRFFLGQNQSLFMQGHQHAFDFFRGCPRVVLYDNLKTAVLERVGDAKRFNPAFLDFASFHGFEPRPVGVRKGNEKGRVERAILYLRTSFFPARTWTSLEDLNAQALRFCTKHAAQRRCPEDRTLTVQAAWEREQPRLLPSPQPPYPSDERIEVSIGKTPYARFDRNDYSVPHTAVRRMLTVLASADTVRICQGDQVLAVHKRSFALGATIEDPAHLDALRKEKHKAREPAALRRLTVAAPAAHAFLCRLAERGGAMGPCIARMERLLDLFGPAELQAALTQAGHLPTADIHAVHLLLDQRKRQLSLPPPVGVHLAEDSPLRSVSVTPHSLSSYDSLTPKDSQ
jgi:transposase